jgi:asparagine synthase (glutamine-hydrolysing)
MLWPDMTARMSGKKLLLGPDAVANRLCLLNGSHLARRAEGWAQIAAWHGLAVTFPMLDRRVVAFALSLPSRLFYRGGWARRVFRDAMADVLPAEILWRRGKLAPFTEGPALVAAQREVLLRRLAELRGHPRVAACFNLDRLEEYVIALPVAGEVPQRARQLCEDDAFAARASQILRTFHYALYIQQHY